MTGPSDPRENGEERTSDVASNAELAERMARVEESLDHVTETLDRIETNLVEDQSDIDDRITAIEPQHRKLWLSFEALKWLLMLTSGGGVLTLFITMAL